MRGRRAKVATGLRDVVHVGQKIEEDGENRIERKQLHALDPVALSIAADLLDDEDGSYDGYDLRHCKLQVHGMSEQVGREDEHGRDKESYLEA